MGVSEGKQRLSISDIVAKIDGKRSVIHKRPTL